MSDGLDVDGACKTAAIRGEMGMSDEQSKAERPAVGVLYDEVYLRHLVRPGHPETPLRLEAIGEALGERDLAALPRIEAAEGQMDWVRAVHTDAYIETVRRDVSAGRPELSTGDVDLCPESFDVAMRAVGGVASAVEQVAAGEVGRVFCAVRPPGHHATPDRGMGFCIFNNAAIAARYAQRHCGIERVLIVDWDIHHGNGTQDVFYDDGSVLYFSTHMFGMWPMMITGKGHPEETGAAAGEGTNINVPLAPGTGDKEILAAFEKNLVPTAKAFAPELAIISAGFDSRKGDPLGLFQITDEGFAELTRMVMGLVPGGRVVSVLEGGYAPAGLAKAVVAHIRAMM